MYRDVLNKKTPLEAKILGETSPIFYQWGALETSKKSRAQRKSFSRNLRRLSRGGSKYPPCTWTVNYTKNRPRQSKAWIGGGGGFFVYLKIYNINFRR